MSYYNTGDILNITYESNGSGTQETTVEVVNVFNEHIEVSPDGKCVVTIAKNHITHNTSDNGFHEVYIWNRYKVYFTTWYTEQYS